jgi:hypothetical protein
MLLIHNRSIALVWLIKIHLLCGKAGYVFTYLSFLKGPFAFNNAYVLHFHGTTSRLRPRLSLAGNVARTTKISNNG